MKMEECFLGRAIQEELQSLSLSSQELGLVSDIFTCLQSKNIDLSI